jgi:hypothetical protein
MIQLFPQVVIDPRDDFAIGTKILAQPIGRLELIEPLGDVYLSSQSAQAFALTTARAFHSASTGWQEKLTLAAPQKVCGKKKNGISSSNHASPLSHHGYESL